MRRSLAWAVAVILAACGADPCPPVGRVVASSTSTDPGTVQSGLLQASDDWQLSATAALAVRSDGTVICVTCTGVVTLGPSLRRLGGLGTPGPAGVVVARDDSIFAVVPGDDIETTDVVALDPTGQIRWRSTLGTRTVSVKLIASDDGLYAWAQPFTQQSALQHVTLFAIDPTTGALRSVATDAAVIGPAHRGVIARAPADPAALQQLDPAGNIVWSHPFRAFHSPEINGSLPSADGGVIVFGTIFSDLDLGDLMIRFTPGDVSDGVIISFDATGATRWGYAAHNGGIAQLTAISGADRQGDPAGEDRFIAAGQRQVGGGLLSPDIDSYLILATPTGVTRQLTIGGPGIQDLFAIAAAPDGAVWAQVLNVISTDDHPEPAPVIEIGDHRFADSGVYLFKIVP
jgi:hypothetical protein